MGIAVGTGVDAITAGTWAIAVGIGVTIIGVAVGVEACAVLVVIRNKAGTPKLPINPDKPKAMERAQVFVTGLGVEGSVKEAEENSSMTIHIAGANAHVNRLACAKYPAPINKGIEAHNGEPHASATSAALNTSGG